MRRWSFVGSPIALLAATPDLMAGGIHEGILLSSVNEPGRRVFEAGRGEGRRRP